MKYHFHSVGEPQLSLKLERSGKNWKPADLHSTLIARVAVRDSRPASPIRVLIRRAHHLEPRTAPDSPDSDSSHSITARSKVQAQPTPADLCRGCAVTFALTGSFGAESGPARRPRRHRVVLTWHHSLARCLSKSELEFKRVVLGGANTVRRERRAQMRSAAHALHFLAVGRG